MAYRSIMPSTLVTGAATPPPPRLLPTLISGIARACKTVRKAAATLRATCRSSTRISIIIYYTRVRHTDRRWLLRDDARPDRRMFIVFVIITYDVIIIYKSPYIYYYYNLPRGSKITIIYIMFVIPTVSFLIVSGTRRDDYETKTYIT